VLTAPAFFNGYRLNGYVLNVGTDAVFQIRAVICSSEQSPGLNRVPDDNIPETTEAVFLYSDLFPKTVLTEHGNRIPVSV
jgi:hypothetical protein